MNGFNPVPCWDRSFTLQPSDLYWFRCLLIREGKLAANYRWADDMLARLRLRDIRRFHWKITMRYLLKGKSAR